MKTKIIGWKRKKKDLWKKGYNYLEIRKVNFSYEKPAHNVVIYDLSIKSYESSLGKVTFIKHLGTKRQALKFAKNYMENN